MQWETRPYKRPVARRQAVGEASKRSDRTRAARPRRSLRTTPCKEQLPPMKAIGILSVTALAFASFALADDVKTTKTASAAPSTAVKKTLKDSWPASAAAKKV